MFSKLLQVLIGFMSQKSATEIRLQNLYKFQVKFFFNFFTSSCPKKVLYNGNKNRELKYRLGSKTSFTSRIDLEQMYWKSTMEIGQKYQKILTRLSKDFCSKSIQLMNFWTSLVLKFANLITAILFYDIV